MKTKLSLDKFLGTFPLETAGLAIGWISVLGSFIMAGVSVRILWFINQDEVIINGENLKAFDSGFVRLKGE